MNASDTFYRNVKEQQARPPLHALPNELLDLVVEQLVASLLSYTDVPPVLKALRLVSRRFAYLKSLNASLFARVELIADPVESQRLKNTSFERVAPHVRHVTFVPPLYNWHMNRELLRVLYRRQGIYLRDLDQVFQAYHMAALVTQTHLRSKQLQKRWSSALGQAPFCHSIQTIIVDYGSMGIDSRNHRPHPIIWPGEHHHLYEVRGLESAGSVEDEFFAAVVSALAEARTQLHEIDFNHATSCQQAWITLPGWSQLDVSNLRELHISPNILRRSTPYRLQEDVGVAEIAEATADLIQRSSGTLSVFGYIGITGLLQVPKPATSLSELKTVELHACLTRALLLSAWIKASPWLESLALGHLSLSNERQHGWKYIFDAVKEHQGLHLCLDHIVVENRNGKLRLFNIDIHTGDKDLEKYMHESFAIETRHGYEAFLVDLKSKCPWFYDKYKYIDPQTVADHEGSPFIIDNPYTSDACAVARYIGNVHDWDESLRTFFAGS
ncbi:uncharacterized protein PV09_01268 [Verruconis gallopava]|uniref:F-box domain-containing protein n=1 Tax=Verruconis gallopava TaxID=253628 RepID=A0A0D1Z5W0_9PEZI|nr:uncharacterized protein PV09_01268 [Verruconis gallopava]KIW08352.1 hypothetical protein PV09_01268 [Verruconis gallopava]